MFPERLSVRRMVQDKHLRKKERKQAIKQSLSDSGYSHKNSRTMTDKCARVPPVKERCSILLNTLFKLMYSFYSVLEFLLNIF